MEQLLDDHKDHVNQCKNNQKLCNEKSASLSEFKGKSMETETKNNHNFPVVGKIPQNKYYGQRTERNPKKKNSEKSGI